MTSAMPVQCSNQLSYEVTQLRAGQFVGLMFSRERNVVWKKCYMKCGVWNQMKISSSHLKDNSSNCLMNLKNSGDSTGFEPMTSAMPVQCSKSHSWEEVVNLLGSCSWDNRHLKIDVYRGPQTSTGHVTRPQARVYGKFSTFSTARGRFSRKSFTSAFICMNILWSHVCLALIYKKNLFLSFLMNFNINKTTVLFLQGLNDNCCTTLKSNMATWKHMLNLR